jgi:hypothetical protein
MYMTLSTSRISVVWPAAVLVIDSLVPSLPVLTAPFMLIVWPAAVPSMVNFADLDCSVPFFDADASWIASVNGEARPRLPPSWDCPPAAAGCAVPVAELPLPLGVGSSARHIA